MSESAPEFKREQLRLLLQEKWHVCRKTSPDDIFCQDCGKRFQDPDRITAAKTLASLPVGLIIASTTGLSLFINYFVPLIFVLSIVFGVFALGFVFHVSNRKLRNYALLIAGSTVAFIFVGIVILGILFALAMIGAVFSSGATGTAIFGSLVTSLIP